MTVSLDDLTSYLAGTGTDRSGTPEWIADTLVFHVMAHHRRFHEPYLAGNRELYGLLAAGELAAAERRLAGYLDAAERQLVDAFTAAIA